MTGEVSFSWAEGEARTAEVLSLLEPGWVCLHDHRWPGRRLANIDHVVVGPGGVFVIDSKNWSGDIRIVGQTSRQNGHSRERTVASAADAGLAVAELIAPYASHVRPVLCFVGDRGLSGWVRDVMVCSSDNLNAMLTTRPAVLGAAQVRDVATRLDVVLRSAVTTPDSRTLRPPTPAQQRPPLRRSPAPTPHPHKPQLAKLVALIVGGMLLFSALPTVLPLFASAVSQILVETVTSEPDACETPAIQRPARTQRTQEQPGEAGDQCG